MLSESDIMKCLNAAGCYGNVKMTFESGPYCIDRPSINASRFAEQIESAATAPLLARIAELERELEEARKDSAAEREECAKVCYEADKSTHPTDLGDAIRARGTK